jgi:hypothetical protein
MISQTHRRSLTPKDDPHKKEIYYLYHDYLGSLIAVAEQGKGITHEFSFFRHRHSRRASTAIAMFGTTLLNIPIQRAIWFTWNLQVMAAVGAYPPGAICHRPGRDLMAVEDSCGLEAKE